MNNANFRRNFQRPKSELLKFREMITLVVLFALIAFRMIESPIIAPVVYTLISAASGSDNSVEPIYNIEMEAEDEFIHRFMDLECVDKDTPILVHSHYVECGQVGAEPIIFLHGLVGTWKLWADVMRPFCKTHRVIAFDLPGMGQSSWPAESVPHDVVAFLADIQIRAISQLNIERFNLVSFDLSSRLALSFLHEYGEDRIIRYATVQAPIGNVDHPTQHRHNNDG